MSRLQPHRNTVDKYLPATLSLVSTISLIGQAPAAFGQTTPLTCNNIYVSVQSSALNNPYPTGQDFHQPSQLDLASNKISTEIQSNY